VGSGQKKKKRTDDVRSTITDIQREQDLDVNKLALQPTFDLGYSPLGVNTIDFVNVSTSIAPAQTSSGFPPQVAGLTVTPHGGSNTQLDLTWTVYGGSDFNYYNVYRGPTGFSPDVSNRIAQPTTNSYNNTGLASGTTYYYLVSTTNDAALEGLPSSQASGTTTGTPPPPTGATLWLPLNNSFADASGNSNTAAGTGVIFGTPGRYGSHFATVNNSTTTLADSISVSASTSTALDFTNGFSYSFWIYQTATGTGNQAFFSKQTDASNYATAYIDQGILSASVRHAGTAYFSPSTTISINTWYHIVVTYNPATHVTKFYKDSVETTTPNAIGISSGQTNLVIGNGRSSLDYPFKGRIDEFMYFKGVVLTQTQVNNLYATNTTT
jgi:hypothetical protein